MLGCCRPESMCFAPRMRARRGGASNLFFVFLFLSARSQRFQNTYIILRKNNYNFVFRTRARKKSDATEIHEEGTQHTFALLI